MARRAQILLLSLLLLGTVLPAPSEAQAAPTCFGKRAPIAVEERFQITSGTEGDDVIVGTEEQDQIRGRGATT